MSAQNFNFKLEFIQHGVFLAPNVVFLEKKKFSNKLQFTGGGNAPCHDATGETYKLN